MKNPFSIYDFLGYLFPGIIFLVLIMMILEGETCLWYKDFSIDYKLSLESSLLFVIVAYVMGHIIAYLSSLCVEDFANRVFDFPSKYLLCEKEYSRKELLERYFGSLSISRNRWWWWEFFCQLIKPKRILKFFIFIILLPITLSVYTFGYSLGINKYITRPLDEHLRKAVIEKTKKLLETLGFVKKNNNTKKTIWEILGLDKKKNDNDEVDKLDAVENKIIAEGDIHRLIMHYAFININESQSKVSNYIALYGFLRAMSMLACLLFDYLFISGLLSIGISSLFDWSLIFSIIASYAIAYILFMAFVKFYRRTTLEDFMTLVVERK